MHRLIAQAIIFFLVISSVPGCASNYGEQRTTVTYYPTCYQPIQDLRAREHNVAKGTIGGAMIGALGGALLGLLASGGKWEGAVVGGATGGVTGTMIGHSQASRQQMADDNRRMANYLQDIDGDISNLDIVGAAAKTSLQCYDRNFQTLLTEIRSKKISREAAQSRYAEIASGREEAIALLGDAASQGENLSRQYEQALAYEEQSPQTTAQQSKNANVQRAKSRNTALAKKAKSMRTETDQARSNTSNQLAQYRKELEEINI